MVYIELQNIENNGVSDWFREREHAIGSALTCTISKKALVNKQILSDSKETVQVIKSLRETGQSLEPSLCYQKIFVY